MKPADAERMSRLGKKGWLIRLEWVGGV